jgi:hypothetical protein
MVHAKKDLDRIYDHGGIFIIFVDRHLKPKQENHIGIPHNNGNTSLAGELPFDNWSFLRELTHLSITPDKGKTINVVEGYNISSILSHHTKDANFNCTLSIHFSHQNRWLSLASNKFGGCVSGALQPRPETDEGHILFFPPIKDKAAFLTQLLGEVLPRVSPRLFPHAEGGKWVHEPEYELLSVQKLQSDIVRVEEEAEKQIAERQQQIEDEQDEFQYLYDLLRETGDPLVDAVKKALEVLGFKDVIDADKELEKSDGNSLKREDLRIDGDGDHLLLIEVKGISGIPKDAEVLQVTKYTAPYMRETGRTNIRELSVVNHQRHIPALERDYPFREELVINAEEQQFGVITTWDLFRLVRGYLKNNWIHENIKDLFYQNGVIEAIPLHYEYVGVIEGFAPKAEAVGVKIEENSIRVGDTIAFALPVEFEEQLVKSLQIDNKPVDVANEGDLVGISTKFTKEQMKPKTKVYRCRPV